MKKLVCILIAVLLASGALAENLSLENGVLLEMDVPVRLDLNGDGTAENFFITYRQQDDDNNLAFVVTGDAENAVYESWLRMLFAAVTDLDGDGTMEILLCGDECSDDYATVCLHYTNDGRLEAVPFPNLGRGENDAAPVDSAYGLVESISGNRITLAGAQSMLGTWSASRTLALENGAFVAADDGFWQVNHSDPEIWDYAALVPKTEIAAIAQDGSPTTLLPSDRLIVTAFDKQGNVCLLTEDGRAVRLARVLLNEENGWELCVDGISEYDLFENLRYAG